MLAGYAFLLSQRFTGKTGIDRISERRKNIPDNLLFCQLINPFTFSSNNSYKYRHSTFKRQDSIRKSVINAKKVIFSFHSDFSIIVNSDKFAYER